MVTGLLFPGPSETTARKATDNLLVYNPGLIADGAVACGERLRAYMAAESVDGEDILMALRTKGFARLENAHREV